MAKSPAAVLIDSHSHAITDGVVGADYKTPSQSTAEEYYLAIDASNAGAAYKHSSGTGIIFLGWGGILLKSQANAKWDSFLGIVTRIDGTDADIIYLQIGSMHAQDTGRFESKSELMMFPLAIDLHEDTGTLTNVAANFVETTTSVNTGVNLTDIGGVGRPAAVGDMLIKLARSSGSGNAEAHYSLWYYVD